MNDEEQSPCHGGQVVDDAHPVDDVSVEGAQAQRASGHPQGDSGHQVGDPQQPHRPEKELLAGIVLARRGDLVLVVDRVVTDRLEPLPVAGVDPHIARPHEDHGH